MTFPFFLSFEVGKQMDQKNCLTSLNRNEITGFNENLYSLSEVEELEDDFYDKCPTLYCTNFLSDLRSIH